MCKNYHFGMVVLVVLIVVGLQAACGDGTIIGTWNDPASGLTWQNPPAKKLMSWKEAMDYCSTFNGGGWRLPTISELRSLIRGCDVTMSGGTCGLTDDCLWYSSCWDAACIGCSSAGPGKYDCFWPSEIDGPCDYWYWSSSTPPEYDIIEPFGWNVGFNDGYVGIYDPAPNHVRCVK